MSSDPISMSRVALDLQRKLIDWCIEECSLTVNFDGIIYKMPHIVQLTYFCEDCGSSFPIRIYGIDLIENRFAQSFRCHNHSSGHWQHIAFIYHKTVPTTISIGRDIDHEETALEKYLKEQN